MQELPELVLSSEPHPGRVARAFVAQQLSGASSEVCHDAQLVVAELVANAELHGGPPVVVRAGCTDRGARVEVEDSGRAIPLQTQRSDDAMTGRGLALVAALADEWGITALPAGGKRVWAELSGAGSGAAPVVDPGLRRAGPDDGEERFVISLGFVSTQLLLDAKRHIDNVVRELTLARSGEAPLPAPMVRLVQSVTEDFAEARAEIRRLALESAAAGRDFTELRLELPLAAADAGERYLLALEEADRYARSARLLTLAPPSSHRAFRTWYVRSLVAQLRAAAAGEVLSFEPFSQTLAREVDRLASLDDSWQRLQLLQGITAELTGSSTVEEVAQTVAAHAGRYPGVETARVFVRTPRRTLRSVAWHGAYDVDDRYMEFDLDADLPASDVVRTREPLFMRNLAQVYARYPELAGYYPSERSLHITPLVVEGRVVGVLTLTFVEGEVADEAQLAFVRAIADTLAQAIDRAEVTHRAEQERLRDLTLLQAQLDVLTGAVAGQPLGPALDRLLVAVQSVASEGMLASVLLYDAEHGTLRHGSAPDLPDAYNEAVDGIVVGPVAGSCGTAAFRRDQVIVEDVQTDPLWADFRHLAADAGLRACWSTPIITGAGELLGTFAMYYPQPQLPTESDQALIDVIVRTAAAVIERSRVDAQREAQLAAERSAAITLQHSLLPAVPETIGAVQLAATYRAGDPEVEVGGDWFDAVEVDGRVVLVVGDVQGHDLQAAALMGQLRTVARTAVIDRHGPAQVLDTVHRYVSRLEGDRLATAVVLSIEPATGEVTVASAGHLLPLHMVLAGEAWQVGTLDLDVGPPLGVADGWAEQVVRLPGGSVLLLYTDGVVESRAWPIQEGLANLVAALQQLAPDVALACVLDAAVNLVPSGLRHDDVAVLAARLP